MFLGLGRVTGIDPIHIEIYNSVRQIQHKRMTIPLKYFNRFESVLDKLSIREVVSGPLDHKSATGWIHYLVIVQ